MPLIAPSQQQAERQVKVNPHLSKVRSQVSNVMSQMNMRHIIAAILLIALFASLGLGTAQYLAENKAVATTKKLADEYQQEHGKTTVGPDITEITPPPVPKILPTFTPVTTATPIQPVDIESLVLSWSADKSNTRKLTGPYKLIGVSRADKPEPGVILTFSNSRTSYSYLYCLYVPCGPDQISDIIQYFTDNGFAEKFSIVGGARPDGHSFDFTTRNIVITDVIAGNSTLPTVLSGYDGDLKYFHLPQANGQPDYLIRNVHSLSTAKIDQQTKEIADMQAKLDAALAQNTAEVKAINERIRALKDRGTPPTPEEEQSLQDQKSRILNEQAANHQLNDQLNQAKTDLETLTSQQ
jgi:hypothetical protein